jgi:hypothetical protein
VCAPVFNIRATTQFGRRFEKEIVMTNLKKLVKPVATVCGLLILASGSFQAVNGQKEQLPDKRRGSGYDYVIIEGDIQVSPEFYRRLQAAARSPQLAPGSASRKCDGPRGVR